MGGGLPVCGGVNGDYCDSAVFVLPASGVVEVGGGHSRLKFGCRVGLQNKISQSGIYEYEGGFFVAP